MSEEAGENLQQPFIEGPDTNHVGQESNEVKNESRESASVNADETERHNFLVRSASRNLEQDTEGANRRSKKSSGSAARKKWKSAARRAQSIAVAKSATGKVKLENKIGVKAETLDEDDVLKVIALSLQRAMRDFGRESAYVRKSSVEVGNAPEAPQSAAVLQTEGKMVSKEVVIFDAADNDGDKKYSVRQPQFECGRIRDKEFQRLRSAFGVSERQYYATLGLQENRVESDLYVISSKDASGKSISFFLLTADQRFIFKLCTPKDVETTAKVLATYTKHVESCCPVGTDGKKRKSTTLLPRYLGLYYLRFADKAIPPVVLVAQVNFFAAAYEIHKKFDLKGSLHGRRASEKERKKKSPVFKDLDWIDEEQRVRFGSKAEMGKVRKQLQQDTALLSSLGLIDYSLLVGVHEMDKSKIPLYDLLHEPFGVSYTRSKKFNNIYYFGIVDVMTPYGHKKRAETFVTGTLMCCRDVSCQPPKDYQMRFMSFCDHNILSHDGDQGDE